MERTKSIILVLSLIAILTSCSDSTSDTVIDDIESTRTSIDILSPYTWSLASTPQDFPEASLQNDVRYGQNRALLS